MALRTNFSPRVVFQLLCCGAFAYRQVQVGSVISDAMKNAYVCYVDKEPARHNANCLVHEGFTTAPASLKVGETVAHRDVPDHALVVCARHLGSNGHVIALFLKLQSGKRPIQRRAPLLALIASKRPQSR